jgi:hypothetical protein
LTAVAVAGLAIATAREAAGLARAIGVGADDGAGTAGATSAGKGAGAAPVVMTDAAGPRALARARGGALSTDG